MFICSRILQMKVLSQFNLILTFVSGSGNKSRGGQKEIRYPTPVRPLTKTEKSCTQMNCLFYS